MATKIKFKEVKLSTCKDQQRFKIRRVRGPIYILQSKKAGKGIATSKKSGNTYTFKLSRKVWVI